MKKNRNKKKTIIDFDKLFSQDTDYGYYPKNQSNLGVLVGIFFIGIFFLMIYLIKY